MKFKDIYFKNEAETEAAVIELTASGAKFSTAGRTHIIVYEAEEQTEAVCILSAHIDTSNEIYEKCTLPAITKAMDCIEDNARNASRPDFTETITAWVALLPQVAEAIRMASRLAMKEEGINPTAADCKKVARDFAAFIVECAIKELQEEQ